MMKRYFLDQDRSSHWYLVPCGLRETWEAWLELPEDDERSWEPPAGAHRVGGAPTLVTFTDPKVE